MDWLPLPERLFDFWPFAMAGIVRRDSTEADIEIHSPGDRWGSLKLQGSWMPILIVMMQFLVAAIVYVQLEMHERHAADRIVALAKLQTANDEKLNREVRERQLEILSAITRNQVVMADIYKETRLQTQLLGLTNEQKRHLGLEIPIELWQLRRDQGSNRR